MFLVTNVSPDRLSIPIAASIQPPKATVTQTPIRVSNHPFLYPHQARILGDITLMDGWLPCAMDLRQAGERDDVLICCRQWAEKQRGMAKGGTMRESHTLLLSPGKGSQCPSTSL